MTLNRHTSKSKEPAATMNSFRSELRQHTLATVKTNRKKAKKKKERKKNSKRKEKEPMSFLN